MLIQYVFIIGNWYLKLGYGFTFPESYMYKRNLNACASRVCLHNYLGVYFAERGEVGTLPNKCQPEIIMKTQLLDLIMLIV